jgi:hypothetical protein
VLALAAGVAHAQGEWLPFATTDDGAVRWTWRRGSVETIDVDDKPARAMIVQRTQNGFSAIYRIAVRPSGCAKPRADAFLLTMHGATLEASVYVRGSRTVAAHAVDVICRTGVRS